MIQNLRLNRLLWILVSLGALVASIIGVANPAIYDGVTSAKVLPGVFTQDILVLVTAPIALVLTVLAKERDFRKHVIVLGIVAFFIYAYGIYSIEQLYNYLYPLYLAILGAAVYTLIYGFSSLGAYAGQPVDVPAVTRYICAAVAIIIAVMFNVIWMARMIPLIQEANRIEFTHSVFVIDLSFIMPGFVIAAVMMLRRRRAGQVGIPVLFVLGVGILSPLALVELVKPGRYAGEFIASEFWLFAILSVLFLVLTVLYLATLRMHREADSA
jgi:hypothetical protein